MTTTAQLGDAITEMALRLATSERARLRATTDDELDRHLRACTRRFRCIQRLTAALVARAADQS